MIQRTPSRTRSEADMNRLGYGCGGNMAGGVGGASGPSSGNIHGNNSGSGGINIALNNTTTHFDR